MFKSGFDFYPLTPERWDDFERLFGVRGGCAGCWCMFPRLRGKDFDRLRGAGTRQAMMDLVRSDHIPGLLAYLGSEPAGWCAVAPREEYGRFSRSPVLKPVDDRPAWAIVCFFVARPYRRQGLMSALVEAAVDYARSQGATIIEAYPEEPHLEKVPDVNIYTGVPSIFLKAGFKEVARRSPNRPILRWYSEDS